MKNQILTLAFIAMATPVLAHAELPSIQLHVTGADPATGTIEASLFDSAESFLVSVLLQESGDVAEDGTFTAEFAGLEEGDYAIVVVHDANDNGILDTGFMGFGGESVAYSNNAWALLGRPSFADARFTVTGGDHLVEISLD